MAIYLQTPPKSVKDCILKMNSYIVMDSLAKGTETYNDIQCTNRQCNSGRYRSWEDIAECVRTYFPKTTDEEILHYMLTTYHVITNIKSFGRFVTCSTIERIRFYYSIDSELIISFDEKMSASNRTWGEIFSLLKISTEKQAAKYRKKYLDISYEDACEKNKKLFSFL